MSKLEAVDLARVVDGERIVDGASFAVEPGEVFVVVGPSGAGKSSLLRLLNRLDEPTAGMVRLDGEDYRSLPPQVLRRRVGLVGQDAALADGTVRENVTRGPRLRGETADPDRVAAALDGIGLADRAADPVSELSGGEAARVALARGVVNDPEVLLLDEPTASLDADTEARVESYLRSLVADGLTVLVVTHDRRQAHRIGDRAMALRDGRVEAVGPVAEVVA